MTSSNRIILGIDPGLATLGFGLVKAEGNQVRHLEHGCVTTTAGTSAASRLRTLYDSLVALRDRYRITDVAMESLFYSRNVRTAMAVGQARGVALLAAVDDAVDFGEYTPTEVKQAVSGYGGARKRQMQEMVRLILGLRDLPAPDDAADALAIAICHAHRAALADVLARA